MADERGAAPANGLAGRLGVAGGGRSAATAFVVGIAGTGLFVASMLLDWIRIDMDPLGSYEVMRVPVSLSDAPYAVVYLLGVLGLLTMLGFVVVRPALAQRLRFGATGLGVGVLAVVAGTALHMRGFIEQQVLAYRPMFLEDLPNDVRRYLDSAEYVGLAGLYVAAGAVVTIVAGIWFAALPAPGDSGQGPAAGAAAALPYVLVPAYPAAPDASLQAVPQPVSAMPVSPVPAAPPPVPPVAAQPAPAPAPGQVSGPAEHWLSPVGRVDSLTVTPSGPIDSGSQTDILRT